MIPALRAAIHDRWNELGISGPAPGRAALHLDSSDPRPHGFVRFRAFRPGNPKPLLTGRIARDGVAAVGLKAEYDLLTSLHEDALSGDDRLFPRPRIVVREGSRVATLLAEPGGAPPSPTRRAGDAGVLRALDAAERWHAAFLRRTGCLEGSEGAQWEPYLRAIHAEQARAESDGDGDATPALEALARDLRDRRDGVVLNGYAHGALAVDRLRVRGDRVGAVAWEHGDPRDAPWADPMHFALDLALRIAPDASRAMRLLGDPDHPLAGFVRRRCEDTGTPGFLGALALPAVAFRAVRRLDRHGALPGEPPVSRWRELALGLARDRLVPAG